MPPAFNRAASTLHALTILSFCLHFVQAAGEPANASVNSKLISEAAAAHPGTVSNDSVRSPPAAEAGSNAAKTLSVSLDSSTVQQPGEQHSATHGLSTASSSNETAATPSWLLTQQDSCPADQATATAEHVTGWPLFCVKIATCYFSLQVCDKTQHILLSRWRRCCISGYVADSIPNKDVSYVRSFSLCSSVTHTSFAGPVPATD